MNKSLQILTYLFFTVLPLFSNAQTGLTVGPPRVYFVGSEGTNMTQYVDVTNPSKDYALELAVSYEDWKYSLTGDNELSPAGTLENSCADWLTISEPYFSLGPGESKRLQLNMNIPTNLNSAINPVYTTMLFVTQMNPRVSKQQEGANIRLAVRSGIKIYYRKPESEKLDVEIENIVYHKKDSIGAFLDLDYITNGNSWTEGIIRVEYLNQETGKQTKVQDINFYSLPGDKRKYLTMLPKELPSGRYTATIILMYGNQPEIKIGEIVFTHE